MDDVEEDFECYEGEQDVDSKSLSNKCSIERQSSDVNVELKGKKTEQLARNSDKKEKLIAKKYGSVTS